jgi:molecular chaperone Hsp33
VTARDRLSDALARFVVEGAGVRGALVSLDASAREILACHAYPPALRRVLAELLAAAALLASTLKFRGSLIVQLQGNGPLRMLVVECDATLALRATAQWRPEAGSFAATTDLATLAGGAKDARLVITLDPKDGSPLYQGIVALEADSIAALIEHYLVSSEQIASRLVLATNERGVRGLLLQRLPSAGAADDEVWQTASASASQLQPDSLLAAGTAEQLLREHFGELDLRLFPRVPARFACGCSKERIAVALRSLGRLEVESILTEQGMIGVTCEFCNRQYTFVAADARALFERETAESSSGPEVPPSTDAG